MTDEEFEAIKARAEYLRQPPTKYPLKSDLFALLAEVERLRGCEAAAREFAQALAMPDVVLWSMGEFHDGIGPDPGQALYASEGQSCFWCTTEFDEYTADVELPHAADCVILKARAWLADQEGGTTP